MKEVALSQGEAFYFFGVVLAVVFISVCVIIMTIIVAARARRRSRAKDLIVNYMVDRGYTMMSFERIRSNINDAYSDDFLLRLPEYFPFVLRRARLKGGKAGLARLTQASLDFAQEGSLGEVSGG